MYEKLSKCARPKPKTTRAKVNVNFCSFQPVVRRFFALFLLSFEHTGAEETYIYKYIGFGKAIKVGKIILQGLRIQVI